MKTLNVVAAILMAGLLCSAASAQIKADINPVVWRVNGEPVYAAEISMMMQNIAAQARQGGGPAPESEALMQAATGRVIDQKLLVQEAKRLAIRNDEKRVADMVKAMENQTGGRQALEEVLASGGSTYDQAVQALRERDLVMQLIDNQVSPAVKISREEVETFYNENPTLFTSKARVRARHIIFSAIAGDPSSRFSNARRQAEAARRRAMEGADFAALATELSEGPSGPTGGDLGFFTTEQMEEAFAKAAFALEPGGISEVVKTRYGFHVIKVEELRPAGTRPLDEIEQEIAGSLHQKKVGERIAGLLDTLRESGTIEAELHTDQQTAEE